MLVGAAGTCRWRAQRRRPRVTSGNRDGDVRWSVGIGSSLQMRERAHKVRAEERLVRVENWALDVDECAGGNRCDVLGHEPLQRDCGLDAT